MKLIAIDVETSGLNSEEASIVSIGAVDMENSDNVFYSECHVWEGATISDGALKVNGMTMEQVTDTEHRVSEAVMTRTFFNWLDQFDEGIMMVAHNASFDRDFIASAAKRADLKNPISFRTVDIHSMMYTHLLQKNEHIPGRLSLNVCLKMLGFDKEPDPHNALTGARCNFDIFHAITRPRKAPLATEPNQSKYEN